LWWSISSSEQVTQAGEESGMMLTVGLSHVVVMVKGFGAFQGGSLDLEMWIDME
jgi:hypothetical protein